MHLEKPTPVLNKLQYVLFFKNFTNMYHKTHLQIKGNIAHVIS